VGKAALFGSLLSAAIDFAALAGDHFWGHGSSGDIGPSFFLTLLFILSVPSMVVAKVTRIDDTFLAGFAHTLAFGLLVNALLGAIVFGAVAAFWQFLVKGSHEN